MSLLFKDKLLSFFNENQKHLESWYPGITFSYLLENLYPNPPFGYQTSSSFYESQYSLNSCEGFEEKLQRLLQGMPIEYINNEGHFFGLNLFVNEHTLIPRFETEILADEALKVVNNIKSDEISLIDIGTGSGCLFLYLLAHSINKLNVWASDISEEALKVARANYFNHKPSFSVSHEVSFIKSDRLSFWESNNKVHLIVSNPPYIKENAHLKDVHFQVQKYEPSSALFLDDEFYDKWFIKLFEQVFKTLEEGGFFLMEGHENELGNLSKMARRWDFSHNEIIEDLTKRPRILKLRK